jgi:hypothetical protein
MWSALPDANVRLALAPDVRLVRASDCTSGWRVLSMREFALLRLTTRGVMSRAIPSLALVLYFN